MCTCDSTGKQINLNHKEAAELAYQAQEGDPDSLILLLEGIREKIRDNDADLLIHSAIVEVIHLCSFYTEMREDCVRMILRKFRQK